VFTLQNKKGSFTLLSN